MTFNREPISWKDHKEVCEAYADMFRKGEITEDFYRRQLKHLGMTPTEADNEVDTHRPK